MLVIRMQRVGRKGHAQFRVVVQDSRRTPTSGKIVAQIGTYDPHSKATNLNKDDAQRYLDHGAQPSPRVARLLKAEGVKLPKWVKQPAKAEGKVKNPDKRRSTRPAEPVEPQPEPAAEAETSNAETTDAEAPAEAEAAETNDTATEPAEASESKD